MCFVSGVELGTLHILSCLDGFYQDFEHRSKNLRIKLLFEMLF